MSAGLVINCHFSQKIPAYGDLKIKGRLILSPGRMYPSPVLK